MAKTKLTPRQKMINIMYIVLIALLALNVDRHVLKAFHLMEKNFISSAASYDKKNHLQMAGFTRLLAKEKSTAQPYYDAAVKAQNLSAEFDLYIEELKTEIISLYNGRLEEEEGEDGITSLKTPESMEKHAFLFMVKDKGQRAHELQNKINSTRDQLLELLKPTNQELFVDEVAYEQAQQANLLQANEPQSLSVNKRSWATINLEYQPAGALVALLTQYQNNAKALEADVISKLMQGVHQGYFKTDHVEAAIIPQSNYVMEGEDYVADVMLIATNSTTQPTIRMNGHVLKDVEQGKGKIQFKASGIGQKIVSGNIEILNPKSGKPEKYEYQHTYQVFEPVATVSPDAMNLLYKTLDNPVSISVPGFSAADIQVQASTGAQVSGSNGKYNVRVDGSSNKVQITVYAKGKNMGTTPFRVRTVPEPKALLGGIANTGRSVGRAQLCAQNKVFASLGSDFAYDLPFVVTSYQFIFQPRNSSATILRGNGNTLTPQMKNLMCRARSGDRVHIENIKAKNVQYNLKRSVPPMALTVK